MREHLILRSGPTVELVPLADARRHVRQSETFDDSDLMMWVIAARQDAEAITRRAFVAQRWSILLDNFPRPGFNVGSANWYGPQWGVNPGPLTVLSPDGFTGYEIFVPFPPTLFIDSITYVDTTGTLQVLDPSQYQFVPCERAILVPVFGTVWPETQQQKAAVTVNFTAGYAAPFLADATLDTISAPLWKVQNVGDTIRVSTLGGTLPAPLQPKTDYFVQSIVSPNVYTLSLTSGGPAIDLTTAGTAPCLVGEVPECAIRWIRVRLGSAYENREEVALLNRGKVELLPYVDGLLDSIRVFEHF